MSDIQEIPQNFELATLLFEDLSGFEKRFQSFVNQFPSYLHSSVKGGFFTHFFLGMFSTLLDTKLNNKSISYGFSNQGILKIAVRLLINGNEEVKFFSFSEKSKSKEKTVEESLFTNDDLERIIKNDENPDKMKRIIDNQKNSGNLKFTLVEIDKYIQENEDIEKLDNALPSKVKVKAEDIEISKGGCYIEYFKKITKILEDELTLESYIEKLYSTRKDIKLHFEKIIGYIKNVFDGLELPSRSEAQHHGFVAGIFNNFRYRYNVKISIEQFCGRGYADLILLVRGPDREVYSIPILIELKAGCSGNEVTAESALKQAKGYVYGCQLNKIRLATSAEDILCVGLNLDQEDAYSMDMITLSKPTGPLIENIIDEICDWTGFELTKKNLEEKITKFILKEYYSFPPTPEKSDTFYFSRFLLGQISSYNKYLCAKHIFIPDSNIKRKTRQSLDPNYIITGPENSLQSTVFIPSSSKDRIVLINIYEIHKKSSELKGELSNPFVSAVEDIFERGKNIGIPINSVSKAPSDSQKIIELNIKIDMRKYKRYSDLIKVKGDIKNFLDIQVKSPVIYKTYKSRQNKYSYKSNPVLIDSVQIMEKFDDILNCQRIQDSYSCELNETYTKLLTEIGKPVYLFKSLIRKEAHFQAVLQGFFDYHSDKKLEEGLIELVLTEFQTGAGDRIDMIIQIIGASKDDINKYKEYIPVGLELKYTSGILSCQNNEYKLELNENELKKLKDQMSGYADGKAIKAITDGREIVVIGVVFFDNATSSDNLILMYENNENFTIMEPRSSITLVSRPSGSDTAI